MLLIQICGELPIIEGNWWVICSVELNWRERFSADSRLEKNSIDAFWSCSTFAIFGMTVWQTVEFLLNYCKFSDANFIGMNDCCLVSQSPLPWTVFLVEFFLSAMKWSYLCSAFESDGVFTAISRFSLAGRRACIPKDNSAFESDGVFNAISRFSLAGRRACRF